MSRSAIRLLSLGRCGSGLAMLVRPDTIGAAANGWAAPVPPAVVRVLGLRLLGQGLVELGVPARRVVLAGASVDAAHATSMIAVAGLAPRYRRAAVTSAAMALASAAAALTATAGLSTGVTAHQASAR